jgi:hypothetical protein
MEFERIGLRRLKGVPDAWDLYRLDLARGPRAIAASDSLQTSMDRIAVQAARHTPRLTRALTRLLHAADRGVRV